MRTLNAIARVLTDQGKSAVGARFTLQIYRLKNAKWLNLATKATDAKGIWRASVSLQLADSLQAPALRLIEGGNPTTRVLAQQVRFTYSASKQVLGADFGVIERLGNTAYQLKASSSSFRAGHTVAGQPKRADVSAAVLIRNMTVISGNAIPTTGTSSPGAVAAASTVAQPHGVLADNFDAEMIRFKARETELQLAIFQKDRQLAARKVEFTSATKRITELQKDLSLSKVSETRLKNENQQFVNEAGRKVAIQDIAANIGTEIDAANKKLRRENRPYRFGRIEIDLKGTVSPDGQKMALANRVDLEKLQSGVSLPGVLMEILPTRTPSVESTSVKVPDVTGLTETAVRRLLQAVGLRLDPVSKSVGDNSRIPIGQSMQQTPEKGSELPRNNTVLVVFAAPEPPEENDS